MANILEIKNLTKKYPKFTLDGVSFSIEEGAIMGLIGRNGAGKTTTIKSILGLVHPDAGEVSVCGLDFKTNESKIKQQIGYTSGAVGYYPTKKLSQITEITKTFYENWDDEAYEKYMKVFKLDPDKKPKELSEGMKVKYLLAVALSHGAKLLILDEPTSGLDPVSRDELLTIFEKLAAKGTTILFSTHITSDLEKCASHITYIKGGKIVDSNTRDKFIEAQGGGTLEDIMVRLEKEEIEL